MKKSLNFPALIFILSLSAFSFLCYADQISEPSQYIRKITFHGNKAINNNTLSEILNIQPGQKFDPEIIRNSLDKILAEYKKSGYMFAKVKCEYVQTEKDLVIVNIEIDEGKIVKMGDIELSGSALFPGGQLLSKLNIRKSPVFDEDIFNDDIERLLRLYSDNGHPLARISPSEFRIENGRLNIKLDISDGALVKIEKIKINGLKKTKENIILRELNLEPGAIFDQRKIDESQRRLNNMEYFYDVSPFQFSQAENDTIILNSSVVEGRTGQFSGLIGYNPSEDRSGESKFIGVLEAAESNLFGTGRRISINGKIGPIDTYELAYKEPWIFNKPVDLEVQLRGTRQVDDITKQRLREWETGLGGSARMTRFIGGSVSLIYKQIRSSVSDQSAGVELVDITPGSLQLSDELTNGRKYGVVLSIQRDSRDYFTSPSAGRLDHVSVEISRGDFKIIKTRLDMNQYLKIFRRQVLALGLHGARIWGDKIPPTEMLRLGGARSLRGYSEDFFRGEGVLFANGEYRFLAGRDSQFFLFLDGGSIYDRDDGLSLLKLGYGLGMRLESLNGLVSMDYGLAKGDPILKGKIHVSLGAAF